ncbi:MAG: hypothetical protein ACE5NW_02205 [Acidiferrobacterales bacterium]
MSIFSKDCPQCGETNAAYAVSCRCGFAFNSADEDSEGEADAKLSLQEEKLYQEYLAARAQQAATAAYDAARLAAAQPGNNLKVKEAEQANATAEGAKAELAAHQAKLGVIGSGLGAPMAAQASEAAQAGDDKQTPTQTTKVDHAPVNSKHTTVPTPTAPATPTPPTTRTAAGRESATAQSDKLAAALSSTPIQNNGPSIKPTTPAASVQRAAKPVGAALASIAKAADPDKPKPATASARAQATDSSATPTAPKLSAPPSKVEAGGSPTSGAQAADNDASSEPTDTADRSLGSQELGADVKAAAARAKKLEEMLRAAQAKRTAKSRAAAAKGAEQQAAATQVTATARTATAAERTTNPVATATNSTSPTLPAIPKEPRPEQAIAENPKQAVKDVDANQGGPATELMDFFPPPEPVDTIEATAEAESTNDDTALPPDTASPSVDEAMPVERADHSVTADDATNASAAAASTSPAASTTTDTHEELMAALRALESCGPGASINEAAEADASTDAPKGANETRQESTAALDTLAAALDQEKPATSPAATSDTSDKQNMKDCPNCTAWIPRDAQQCGCGFAFPAAEEKMPSLSLSDSDVAALGNSTQSSGITRLN